MPSLPSLTSWGTRVLFLRPLCFVCLLGSHGKIGTESGPLCKLHQAMPVPVNENLVLK